ncbi:MAG: hypothetical protein ACK4L4_09790 [Gemmobacter sp.]
MKALSKTWLLAVMCWPGAALAADFGRVRWPDYLDPYIYAALAVAVPSVILMKILLPSGYYLLNVPAEKRTPLLNVVGAVAFVSFVSLMGLVFTGMYLQRAAEWPDTALSQLFR